MSHRQRVLTALGKRPPDCVPWDYWATSEITEELIQHLGVVDQEALLRKLEVDLRYWTGPSYVGQEMRAYPDGSVEDLWGVRRHLKTMTRAGRTWSYKHVVDSPLAYAETVADVDAYDRWPDADRWDYAWDEQEAASFEGCAVVNAGDRLDRTAQLKTMMYLRGTEQTFVDLLANPAVAEAIISHIVEYFLEYNRRVFEAASEHIDIFMMGDDFGTQYGPMMSLETWRRLFKPGFRAYIELAHEHGLPVMHHTCGSVRELIPDFIECGLDILQSLQPAAAGMDLAELQREFGRDLCFHGGIDIQEVLPHGTLEQVREHVKSRAELGREGGYILCTAHNIQPDTPLENIVALFEAYQEFA